MAEPHLRHADYRRDLRDIGGFNWPLLVNGGISLSKQPLPLEPHRHIGFELHYLERGQLTLETDTGTQLDLQGGSCSIMRPGVLHQGRNNIVPPGRLFWLIVDPDISAAESGPYGAAGLQALHDRLHSIGDAVSPGGSACRTAFRHLLTTWRALDTRPNDPLLLASLRTGCALLIDAILAACADHDNNTPMWSPTIVDAVGFMRSKLTATPTVADMATRVGCSVSHFHACFRREVGMSPAQYHLHLRIAHARRMLDRDRERPVAEIAAACGFVNSKYFATCFKRYTGVSPRLFREQVR